MHMQADGIDGETQPLGLARPAQARVKMRVVLPARFAFVGVGEWGDHADFGIVLAPVGVTVAEDFSLSHCGCSRSLDRFLGHGAGVR